MEVTVTVAEQPPVTGALVRMDDFSVSLREASGEYRAFNRGPGVTVVVQDPLAAHHELLDRYTDTDMHNLDGLSGEAEMRGRFHASIDSVAFLLASVAGSLAQGTVDAGGAARAVGRSRGRCTTATTPAADSAR